jgi:hypothetical protein
MRIFYHITVSLIHVVPKQVGLKVVKNKDDELLPALIQSRRRVELGRIIFYSHLLIGWSVWLGIGITASRMVIMDITRSYGPNRLREDDVYLSFWDIRLPLHTLWVVQCTLFFLAVHDFFFFYMVEHFMDNFSLFSSSFECVHCLTLVSVRCKEKSLVLN